MLYRIEESRVVAVPGTSIAGEALFERDFEDWVEASPGVFGEPLLVIGRQVELDGGRDRIDLLALDTEARLVVIELKRDLVGGDADLQPVRYAALLASWRHDDVKRQAEGYWNSTNQQRGTFAQEVASFCDEDAEVNNDQRIILAGIEMAPRLGTVALWLRVHGIDTQVVTVSLFKDAGRLYLQPQVVIPIPSEEGISATVSGGSSDKPWKKDGRSWHLEQRCAPETRQIVERLVDIIEDAVPDAHGPSWSQKDYVSWRVSQSGRLWTYIVTGPQRVLVAVQGLQAQPDELAERLGWAKFDGDAGLAEKLALGSSVGEEAKGLRFIVKDVQDLGDQQAKVLQEALHDSWVSLTGSS